MRLIQTPRRLRRSVELCAVQRREATIAPTRHVRRYDVGVQLRVKGAAHAVAIGRRHEPLSLLDKHPVVATAHHHCLLLQIPQRGSDRLLMAGDELSRDILWGDREQDTERLRRREREVERRDRGLLRRDPQADTGVPRIEPRDQRTELLGTHAATEPKRLCPPPHPHARSLAPARVVVITAARDLLLVVAVLAERDLADREHPKDKLAKAASF
jgi:hypothetical protein